ncbi:heme oxygenase [Trema orientale]|uniref:Heme oxygenase n=1 Tax=Trema orientale TaxID=63057 RepID=A0A2P5D0L6_TREOI|nr:heme oxygenase [Trema orientale]
MAKGKEIAGKYWEKYKKQESPFALYSPFLVCVAAGDLDFRSFNLCISQDYYFLDAFVQAYRLAEDSVERKENKKLKHNLRERTWGFGEVPKMSRPDDTTDKYMDFLVTIACGKVGGEQLVRNQKHGNFAAFTLSATAPYMRLYAHLCDTILTNLDPNMKDANNYGKWLEYYSSQAIKDLAQKTDYVLDILSESLNEEELLTTEKVYHQAMKIQVEFLASRPMFQQTVVPLSRFQILNKSQLTIFSNFSFTCSVEHFSAELGKIAVSTRTQWHDITKQYLEELQQCIESSTTASLPSPTNNGKNFHYDDLTKALEQVAGIEKKRNAKVEESGMLKGVSLDGIKRAGEKLVFRNGCKEFFRKIRNENPNINVHFISSCWCGALIISAFSPDVKASNIHANELMYNEESLTTGKIVKNVESPFDKHQAFMKVQRDISVAVRSSGDQGKHLEVYIGGSVGDLLCLVEADIGIVFGSDSSLRTLRQHFGLSFVPLLQGVVKKQMERVDWKPQLGILYTVESWAEIQSFISGFSKFD